MTRPTVDSLQAQGRLLWMDAERIDEGCDSYLEILQEVFEIVADAFTFDEVEVEEPGEFVVMFTVDGERRPLMLEDERDWMDMSFFGGLNEMLDGDRRLWILPSGGQDFVLGFLTEDEAKALREQDVQVDLPPRPNFGGAGAEAQADLETARFLDAMTARLGDGAVDRLAVAVTALRAHIDAGNKASVNHFGTFRADRHGQLSFRPGRGLRDRLESGTVEPQPATDVRAGAADAEALGAVFAEVSAQIQGEDRVARVPGLGVFRAALVPGGRFRNPADGAMINIPDRMQARFVPEG
jgi:nucleoid DNA-binding protein